MYFFINTPTIICEGNSIELTNGEYFNQVLEEGAKTWIDTFGENSGEIPRELYQNALLNALNALTQEAGVSVLDLNQSIHDSTGIKHKKIEKIFKESQPEAF